MGFCFFFFFFLVLFSFFQTGLGVLAALPYESRSDGVNQAIGNTKGKVIRQS